MKIVTYLCENCFEPYEFNPEYKREDYICPKCGEKMMYWSTSEIDEDTNLVINGYTEESRRVQNPGKPTSSQYKHLNPPTITCPYCQSTKCSKISILGRIVSVEFWGLASNKLGKQWHCHDCGSNF